MWKPPRRACRRSPRRAARTTARCRSALENSNVNLTTELVNLIKAQRDYQANAQTIKTQQAVDQTLLNMR